MRGVVIAVFLRYGKFGASCRGQSQFARIGAHLSKQCRFQWLTILDVFGNLAIRCAMPDQYGKIYASGNAQAVKLGNNPVQFVAANFTKNVCQNRSFVCASQQVWPLHFKNNTRRNYTLAFSSILLYISIWKYIFANSFY